MLHKSEIYWFNSYLKENKFSSKTLSNGGIQIGELKFNPNKEGFIKLSPRVQYLQTCFEAKIRPCDYKFWILDKHKRKQEHYRKYGDEGYKLFRFCSCGYRGLLVYAKYLEGGVHILYPMLPGERFSLGLKNRRWFDINHEEFNMYYMN